MLTFRKLAVRTQLQMLALVTIIVVAVIVFLTYYKISLYSSKKNSEMSREFIKQSQQNATLYCEQINDIIYNIVVNRSVNQYLLETDPLEIYKQNKNIAAFLGNIKNLNNGIYDILIVGKNNYVDVTGLDSIEPEFGRLVEKGTGITYSDVYFQNASDSNKVNPFGTVSSKYFIAASNIYDLTNNSEPGPIGQVALYFDARKLGTISNDLAGSQNIKYYYLDKSLNIYSTNDKAEKEKKFSLLDITVLDRKKINQVRIGNEEKFVQILEIPYIKGYMVSISDKGWVDPEVLNMQVETAIILLAALLVLSIPFVLFANNLLKPLKKFMEFLKSIESGNLRNLKKRIDLDGYAEISVMAHRFNGMLDHVNNLTHQLVETSTKLYEAELIKKQTELALLHSQINPHFLYNTLESIKGMALSVNADDIWEMTRALGRILKFSIKGPEMVTIGEELDIAMNYIKIQQLRFQGRFDIVCNMEEDILEYKIPKMTLQPLIENAIYHGVELRTRKGIIEITGRLAGDGLIVISVRDNGAGIGPDKLEVLQKELHEDLSFENANKEMSIGIRNVNHRIRLTFGADYGLSIKSIYDEGTTVEMKLSTGRNENA